jgi:NAD(P)H-hydrate repair Nnr-like enzyme with NAD(P)H-hydrate epimerase domain
VAEVVASRYARCPTCGLVRSRRQRRRRLCDRPASAPSRLAGASSRRWRRPSSPAAQWAAARWKGETGPLVSEPGSASLYIDCLFGAGLSRPLEGEADRLARVMPGAARIVAVDVPSGIHGDTGRPLGERA